MSSSRVFKYGKALLETTGEVDGFRYPQHVYFLYKTKLVGFIREGEETIKVFSKPLKFDRRRRMFKELKYEKAALRFEG